MISDPFNNHCGWNFASLRLSTDKVCHRLVSACLSSWRSHSTLAKSIRLALKPGLVAKAKLSNAAIL
ncbi:MAG: hypothetical protein ACI845_001260 [Gammaproteobacteria bacterium]|jgi:hypothetical protein